MYDCISVYLLTTSFSRTSHIWLDLITPINIKIKVYFLLLMLSPSVHQWAAAQVRLVIVVLNHLLTQNIMTQLVTHFITSL